MWVHFWGKYEVKMRFLLCVSEQVSDWIFQKIKRCNIVFSVYFSAQCPSFPRLSFWANELR